PKQHDMSIEEQPWLTICVILLIIKTCIGEHVCIEGLACNVNRSATVYLLKYFCEILNETKELQQITNDKQKNQVVRIQHFTFIFAEDVNKQNRQAAQTMEMMYTIIADEFKSMDNKDMRPEDYLNFFCLGNREEPPSNGSPESEKSTYKSAEIDIEFMKKKLEDLDKPMKRRNDKLLKIEHELCERITELEMQVEVILGYDWKIFVLDHLEGYHICLSFAVVGFLILMFLFQVDYVILLFHFIIETHVIGIYILNLERGYATTSFLIVLIQGGSSSEEGIQWKGFMRSCACYYSPLEQHGTMLEGSNAKLVTNSLSCMLFDNIEYFIIRDKGQVVSRDGEVLILLQNCFLGKKRTMLMSNICAFLHKYKQIGLSLDQQHRLPLSF
ncbi:hypothetical protein ACJX0J_035346, partial [Zea mays]